MKPLLALTSFLIILYSCDFIQEDAALEDGFPEQISSLGDKSYFATPNGSALIDLSRYLKASKTVTLSMSRTPERGSARFLEGGYIRYTPFEGFSNGQDWFVVDIKDNQSLIDSDTISIQVAEQPDNCDSLSSYSQYLETYKNNNLILPPLSSAYNCLQSLDSTTISALIDPENGSLGISDGLLTYDPDSNFVGYDNFAYKLCLLSDPDSCLIVSVKVNVTEWCQVRVYDDYAELSLDSADFAVIDVLSNDSLCDLEFSGHVALIRQAANGHAETDDNDRIIYTPDPGFTGYDSLVYEKCYYGPDCRQATVTIFVTGSGGGIPCETLANDDLAVITEDTTDWVQTGVRLFVLANDQYCNEGDVVLSLSSQPDDGYAQIENNDIIYYPNDNTMISDSLVYSLCEKGSCDEAKAVIQEE